MSDYISREAALKAICDSANSILVNEDPAEASTMIYLIATSNAREAAKGIAAADVRPVVHGKWRFEKGDGKTCVDGWVCMACNCGFHTNVPYFECFNFCPNCGADMRPREADNGND